MKNLAAPAPLNDTHDLTAFDCGEESLNVWLKRHALKNNQSGGSRTYVIARGRVVIGYYCLAAGAIGLDQAPKKMRRNMPNPIPVLVLGRLAIHKDYHNQGLGSALLRDAVLRTRQAGSIAGVTALLVHALSENAKRFYLSRGFIESPIRPMTLCLMLKMVDEVLGT